MSEAKAIAPNGAIPVLTIWQAIPKITGDVAPIAKGRKNQQQGYSFRGIDDVYAALNLLLAKYGVSILPKVLDSQHDSFASKSGGTMFRHRVRVQYKLVAADGSHDFAEAEGEGMDSGDKATPKAFSTAYKTMCFEVFCIPTGEKIDSEEDSPEIAPVNGSEPALSPEDQARIQGENFETFKKSLLATKDEAARVKVYAEIKQAHETKQITDAQRKLLLAVANTVSAGLKPAEAKA